jgi:hypothetical protein
LTALINPIVPDAAPLTAPKAFAAAPAVFAALAPNDFNAVFFTESCQISKSKLLFIHPLQIIIFY